MRGHLEDPRTLCTRIEDRVRHLPGLQHERPRCCDHHLIRDPNPGYDIVPLGRDHSFFSAYEDSPGLASELTPIDISSHVLRHS